MNVIKLLFLLTKQAEHLILKKNGTTVHHVKEVADANIAMARGRMNMQNLADVEFAEELDDVLDAMVKAVILFDILTAKRRKPVINNY